MLGAEFPKFGVIIPTRLGATRLPGKPLRTIAGKPMILYVLELARRAGAEFVWVATDSVEIAQVVRAAGGEVVMTSAEHRCGSDRIAEAARVRGLDPATIVVNVQGDEPLLPAQLVGLVARNLAEAPAAGIATLATRFRASAEVRSPNVVKVVAARSGLALYFSRAPIPHQAEGVPEGPVRALRHIGLYAYRVSTLCTLAEHGPVPLEMQESLEQLRALWLGIGIHVHEIDEAPAHGVDTEADLERVTEVVRSRGV